MSLLLYNLFIYLYPTIIRLISPFNKKARLWHKGRKQILKKIESALLNEEAKRIWFHAASLGEFEQGKPLIEAIKNQFPQYKIVLTFFSPSGYEYQKNYRGADYTFYLPMDSSVNSATFYNLVKPSLVFFIKYEYWYYYLREAKSRQIPVFLVAGIFLPGFSFFKWYGGLNRKVLTFFKHLFVQNNSSLKLLQSIQIEHASIAGDTRFDRVLEVANAFEHIPIIAEFCKGKKVVVAGSTWTEDDETLDHFTHTQKDIRFIVAPHDISSDRLEECKKLYKHAVFYSGLKTYLEVADTLQIESSLRQEANVLIIDNIGLLKYLYYYGDVCFIGGGFRGNGIHNILEAAVYGKPVVFGPEHEKFAEAMELIDVGGAFPVNDALQLERQLQNLLSDDAVYKTACEASKKYVEENAGATNKVIQYIQANRLLTS